DHGQATGGHGNTGTGTSVVKNLGAGGGVFNGLGNYNSTGYGQFDASVINLSGCWITNNQAQGGGNGAGGGIACFDNASATVSFSTISNNVAIGTAGSAGLGGGAFDDASSSLVFDHDFIIGNHANGSTGIGGGVYNLGVFSFSLTTITGNQAS